MVSRTCSHFGDGCRLLVQLCGIDMRWHLSDRT